MNTGNSIATARFHDLLKEVRTIATVTHTHPDGDAVGSSIALNSWLSSLGKDVVSVFPDEVSDSIKFIIGDEKVLVYSDSPQETEDAIKKADLIVCLDFNSFSRSEGVAPLLEKAECRKVMIDHHPGPDTDSFDICISETEISSASELLYWVLMEMPETGGNAERLPMQCASALMTGMTTDTNNFGNSTFPSTFRMASSLLAAGVDRDLILSRILQCYRENRVRLMGHLFANVMKITPDGAAYMVLDSETLGGFDVREGDTEGFVNIPLTIKDVKMSIFLKEDNGFYRVSVRSRRGISANIFAKTYFNGGGHEQAAGGKLRFPEDIADKKMAAEYIEAKTAEFFREI